LIDSIVRAHNTNPSVFLVSNRKNTVSHLTFSLPFLPLATTTLHPSDIVGLIVIVAGIILYRFSYGMITRSFCKENAHDDDNHVNHVVEYVDAAANNRSTGATNSEPATVGVVNDRVVLETDDDNNNNNGQEVGVEGKEDPLLSSIQPIRRTGDV
jgi:hypothetical protein